MASTAARAELPLSKDIDLAASIAAELQGDQGQEHRLARAGRADDQHMADIVHMGGEPERRRTGGLGIEKRRRIKMAIAHRPGPDRRQRHEMGEVQCVKERLADIGVNMAGQRAEPGLYRIDALANAGKTQSVDDPLNGAGFIVSGPGVHVDHRDGGGEIAETDMTAAKRLQGRVGVTRLVVGVAINQGRRLIGQHFAQDGGDRLAPGEPLPPQPGQNPGRRRLVERDKPCHPAIGKILMVERIKKAGAGDIRKTEDGQGAQMLIAQHRLQPAGEGCVDEHAVEIHGRFRDSDRMALRGDRPMQEGQGLRIIERADFGQETAHEVQHPLGLLPEPGQFLPPVPKAALPAALQKGIFGARLRVRRRHIQECEVIAALEMPALTTFFKSRAAFFINQP